ncbi:MAG: narK [Deltaproteobacteria bacterium]|nr:narK [Deltaproteobacteria bacterium]
MVYVNIFPKIKTTFLAFFGGCCKLKHVGQFHSLKGKGLYFLGFLWFIWFMNFSVRTIFSPIMPLIEDEFAVSHSTAASLFFWNSAGYSVSLFLSGLFSGYFGYRRSVSLSLFISALIFIAVPFSRTFSHLIVLGSLLGLTSGIYLPAIIPMITHYYNEKTWGKVIASHDSAASMSIFAVPFLAILLLSFMDWRGIFYIFGGLFILLSLIFHMVCMEVRVPRSERGHLLRIVRSPSLWLMGTMWVFAAGANLGIYFVTPLYLTKELGLDIKYANEIFGFSRLGGVVLTIAMGFAVDRFSLKRIMFIQLLLGGLLTFVIPFAGVRHIGWALFGQASVIMGFFPVGLVAVSRMFSVEERSLATGIMTTFGVICGLGFIPYLLGLSGDMVGFKWGICLLGICVIMASGLTRFLRIP